MLPIDRSKKQYFSSTMALLSKQGMTAHRIRNSDTPAFKVVGSGWYLPKRVVKANEIDGMIGKREGWTAARTGVLERRWVGEESQSWMGARAAEAALEKAGLSLGSVDLLIAACGTPEQPIPCTGARILAELDSAGGSIAAFDVNATCLSFLVALEHAVMRIETGRSECVLIVSSEIASFGLDPSEAESTALMGDGAAAVVLQRCDSGSRLLYSRMQTYPEGVDMAELRGGGTLYHPSRRAFEKRDHCFRMEGRSLFKLVAKHLVGQVEAAMASQSFVWADIRSVVVHQASGPAVELLAKQLGVPDAKLVKLYPRLGNTIAASLPMGMHELMESGKLDTGDKVLFIGTSAGVSIATLILEW